MSYIEREKVKAMFNDTIISKAAKSIIDDCPAANVVEIPNGKIGDLSDGYHTFNELYHHRAILFSVICNSMPDKAWKSKLHDTGDMYEGMFIVGIETPEGQATYHYDIEPYWDIFKVKELEKAPKWDGHSPQVAIDRIAKISADVEEVRHGYWTKTTRDWAFQPTNCKYEYICSACGERELDMRSFCPNCGARMDAERSKK